MVVALGGGGLFCLRAAYVPLVKDDALGPTGEGWQGKRKKQWRGGAGVDWTGVLDVVMGDGGSCAQREEREHGGREEKEGGALATAHR